MENSFIKRASRLLIDNLIIIMLLLVWFILGELGLLHSVFIPNLLSVIKNTSDLFVSGEIIAHLYSSVKIILVGFLLSCFIAVPLGVFMGSLDVVNKLLQNFIELIRPISPIALFPLFIFLFGIGFIAKLAIVIWVSWIPILFNTIIGVKKVNPQYIKLAKVLGANRKQIIFDVVIPSALPFIITGMRLAIGSSLLVIVAAEMIGSNQGLGFFILNASSTFQIEDLYSGIISVAFLGISLNSIFLFLDKRLKNLYN